MKKNILITIILIVIIIGIVLVLKNKNSAKVDDIITIDYYETIVPAVEGYKSPEYSIRIREDGKIYENNKMIKEIDENIMLNYVNEFSSDFNLSSINQMMDNKYKITIKNTQKFYSDNIANEIFQLIQFKPKF